MQSKRRSAFPIALGGVLAALAVVVMSMGTLIPVATYACPMLCCMVLEVVRKLCGSRIGWAWYGAVAILSLLMAPDKEAAAVFCCIGYYPLVKPKLDKMHFKWIWKALLFNGCILAMYWALMHLFGLEAVAKEFEDLGAVFTAVLLLLGNVTFFLLDKVLESAFRRRK